MTETDVVAYGRIPCNIPQIIRAFRSLRALKLLDVFKGVRSVSEAIARAVPGIVSVFIFALFLYFICGVVFLTVLKGTFYEVRLCSACSLHYSSLLISAVGLFAVRCAV